MQEYQRAFIQLAMHRDVLRFGLFTLKSGRKSPYFFNAGLFQDGLALSALGKCYAETIQRSGIDYDVIFGPAYKGIPIASDMLGFPDERTWMAWRLDMRPSYVRRATDNSNGVGSEQSWNNAGIQCDFRPHDADGQEQDG